MNTHTRDNALSEVIGMILILAIIVMTMSVYITYTVPEKGKGGEIVYMNEIRTSFLELSYLIDSLWVHGKTGVSVSVPITLHHSPNPAVMPLFSPISSQGFIEITNETGTCTITFGGLVEQRVLNYPDEILSNETGKNTIELRENPQSMVINFTPTVSPNTPTDGIVATLTLYDKNSSKWQVELKIRSVLTNVTRDDTVTLINDSAVLAPITRYYLHSLIAVETSSQLEYLVIDNISESVSVNEVISVDLKPVLDLFRVPLMNGSPLSFSPGSNLTFDTQPNLTISYSSRSSSQHTISTITSLTDLMFASSNYYWIDQQYLYHKGGVFLRQEGNSTSLLDIPLRIEENGPDSFKVSIVDIELHPKNNRVRSSGGRAQVVAQIHKIQNQLRDNDDKTVFYDTSDAMAKFVEFAISSDNEDTIQMWGDIFRNACATIEESTCKPDISPGWANLTVSSSEGSMVVQYTKVDVDLEIRV